MKRLTTILIATAFAAAAAIGGLATSATASDGGLPSATIIAEF